MLVDNFSHIKSDIFFFSHDLSMSEPLVNYFGAVYRNVTQLSTLGGTSGYERLLKVHGILKN